MIHIPNLRPGEKIETILKRHWIVYFILWIYFFLWIFLTLVIWWFFRLNPYLNLLLVIFWMGYSIFLFIEWLDHELDMFVITNNRIIGVEQLSFLNRVVSECNLWQVQEVNSNTKGLFANVLNYGVVTIQTAGNATNFLMEFCPEPLGNARNILNIVDNYRDKFGGSKSLDGLNGTEQKIQTNHDEERNHEVDHH